tara:strand:- start:400 stop:693 length:294 start_codon:yes stop_codon:yes gene_type:complete
MRSSETLCVNVRPQELREGFVAVRNEKIRRRTYVASRELLRSDTESLPVQADALSDYFSQRIGVPHRFAQQALQNLIADGELVIDIDTDKVFPWVEN